MISPLNVTITTVDMTLGSAQQQPQQLHWELKAPIKDYTGEKLFVSRSISADLTTLTIAISDIRVKEKPLPSDFKTVTSIKAVLTYNGTSAKPKVPFGATYDGNVPIVSMKLSADLTTGHLFVTDEPAQGVKAPDDFLAFVLLQENVGTPNSLYMVNWLAPNIDVGDAKLFPTARIVPPANKGGSITGPMGIATP